MKNAKGITLISLVITIAVMVILASIATYSGIDIVRSSKLTAFSTELKIMQTQVNAIYEDKEKANIGVEIEGNVKTQADKVFTASESGITSQEGYKYWDQQLIKDLGIEGVEQDFFVNLEQRSIISYQGFEYKGKTYYTLQQIPSSLYNVEYSNPNEGNPTFEVNIEKIGNQKWRITIPKESINYTSGYIDKWQVQYQLEGRDYWNTSEDLSFVVKEKGNYRIKILNGSIESEEKEIVVEYNIVTVEEAITAGTVFETNTEIKDTYGNKVTVPEGFKIASDSATDVTGGVVIEDVNHIATTGSQFVWIPVGTIYTNNEKTESKAITLGRYVFNTDGTIDTSLSKTEPQDQLKISSSSSYYYTEGLKDDTTTNTHAKDIEAFKASTSAEKAGGYYIGRYEAGDLSATNDRTNSSGVTGTMVSKAGQLVYNYVTQSQAATLSRNMYNSSSFESDLMNSYAWDTAIVFIQEFSEDIDYARQTRLQNTLSKTGEATDGTNKDVRCNIYDMASNAWEWTTETYSYSDSPCVGRGGDYSDSDNYTSGRYGSYTTNAFTYSSFRPTIYVK